VPIAGVWLQDWVGKKQFPEGERLMWNWQLNRDHYPSWDKMVDQWTSDGVKAFIYINPYIANLSDGNTTLRQN